MLSLYTPQPPNEASKRRRAHRDRADSRSAKAINHKAINSSNMAYGETSSSRDFFYSFVLNPLARELFYLSRGNSRLVVKIDVSEDNIILFFKEKNILHSKKKASPDDIRAKGQAEQKRSYVANLRRLYGFIMPFITIKLGVPCTHTYIYTRARVRARELQEEAEEELTRREVRINWLATFIRKSLSS